MRFATSILASLLLIAATTSGCKKEDSAKTPDTKPSDKPASPTAPTADKATPAAKPLEFTATVDVGAAVVKADADDTSWNGIAIPAPAGAQIDTAGGSPSLVITDHMSIALGGERDISEKKQQAKEDSLQVFVRFLVEEPDAILWETKSSIDGSSNFLLVANVKLGDKVKSCTTAGYGDFTQANAEAVLKACRGMKAAASQ